MVKGAKQPRTGGIAPKPTKTPRFTDSHFEGRPLGWRFSACDKSGPFPWPALSPSDKFQSIVEKMLEFETKTLAQLNDCGCHAMPINVLEKPARDRLTQIELDDYEELWSFRCSGAERIWCIPEQNIMRILWWDPDHQVYIVPKDRRDREKAWRRKKG